MDCVRDQVTLDDGQIGGMPIVPLIVMMVVLILVGGALAGANPTGRTRALFGLGAVVALGLIYWVTFGAEKLGIGQDLVTQLMCS